MSNKCDRLHTLGMQVVLEGNTGFSVGPECLLLWRARRMRVFDLEGVSGPPGIRGRRFGRSEVLLALQPASCSDRRRRLWGVARTDLSERAAYRLFMFGRLETARPAGVRRNEFSTARVQLIRSDSCTGPLCELRRCACV